MWNGVTTINKIFYFFLFLNKLILSNTLAIHLSVSIWFNIIKSKDFLIKFAPDNLCHDHKWPIKVAKQNGVTYLKMTNYNSKVRLNHRNNHISNDYFIFIFQKYSYWKILEVSVFKHVFEIRSISISTWKFKY